MTKALRQSNVLTVDVEDYFHASAFTELVPCEAWDRQPSRVVQNTKKVLELLAEFGLRGTFFVLGWVAKRYPSLKRSSERMPRAKARAAIILAEFEKAETELVGKAVILTDGKAGTVDNICLDALHGIRISIRGHEGKWPVSTIKLAQAD